MSLCDRCYSPGHCCKDIPLIAGPRRMKHPNTSLVWLRTSIPIYDQLCERIPDSANEPHRPMPFRWKKTHFMDRDDEGEVWIASTFSCVNIQPDGRCGDYENRPDLCRTFEPAGDSLCIHYSFMAESPADDVMFEMVGDPIVLVEDFDAPWPPGLVKSEVDMEPKADVDMEPAGGVR